MSNGQPPGSAWGVFGADDQMGSLNHITPAQVVRAGTLVRKGAVFPLNLPLDQPQPQLYGRGSPEHHLLAGSSPIVRDDFIDNFWLQASTQWDSLRHIRHPELGWYNGVRDVQIVAGSGGKLGMDVAARRGIAGRAAGRNPCS